MGSAWAIALRLACGASFLLAFACATPAAAQQTRGEVAARSHFETGRAAFQAGDYESALVLFRHAYDMRPSSALLYNIGVTAELLQREQEALGAFERYLEEAKNPADETQVRERIKALRISLAEKQAARHALMALEHTGATGPAFQMSDETESSDRPSTKKKWPWLVAAAAVAVAGVTAGLVVSQGSKSAAGGLKVEW